MSIKLLEDNYLAIEEKFPINALLLINHLNANFESILI